MRPSSSCSTALESHYWDSVKAMVAALACENRGGLSARNGQQRPTDEGDGDKDGGDDPNQGICQCAEGQGLRLPAPIIKIKSVV